jgi:Protein of unknown function (DUF2996)
MADEILPSPAPEPAPEPAPAKAPKAEKPPAIEAKPLPDFMAQDCLPALKQKLESNGINDIDLSFGTAKVTVKGYGSTPDCWQLIGKWQADRQPRQFNIYFFDADLQGQRGFSYSSDGTLPSTMESFRIDERKLSLDLLVSGVLQRLDNQKWLDQN